MAESSCRWRAAGGPGRLAVGLGIGRAVAIVAYRTCGVRVDTVDLATATARIVGAAAARHATAVHLCNAYTLSLARHDPRFAALLDGGDLNLMDGMPLVWLARRLGCRTASRVYGPDLMVEVVRAGRDAALRHYLYGGFGAVPDRAARRLGELAPGADIVGADGPDAADGADAEARLVERLDELQPNVVWVALGTPRQDRFVARMRDRFPCVWVPVGAAFDFLAGAKRQAPRWMQRAGLEWSFRLATEPRRLARRYLVGNTRFLVGVWRGGARPELGGVAR